MIFLGLDLSTKTGYAILRDGQLVDFGKINAKESSESVPEYAMIARAESVSAKVTEILQLHRPDLVCIEQTNLGRSRSTQKELEFIHYAVLSCLKWGFKDRVIYVDTSAWRSVLKISLSKDQRKHNKAVNAGEIRGKITPKHLAVSYVNQKYSLQLLLKDNDEADAVCLAEYAQLKYKDFGKPIPFDFSKTFS
jgi:hypothetical protein